MRLEIPYKIRGTVLQAYCNEVKPVTRLGVGPHGFVARPTLPTAKMIWDEFFIKCAASMGAVEYGSWVNDCTDFHTVEVPALGVYPQPAPVRLSDPKETTTELGAKYDTGKAMWGLLFTGCRNTLRGIVAVLNYGAMKYPKPPLFNSWRDVPDATKRYHEAFLRHSNELDGIEGLFKLDEESGLPAIDHVITNLIFIRELNQELIMHNIRTWCPPPEGSKGFDLDRTLTAQNICTENERLTKGI